MKCKEKCGISFWQCIHKRGLDVLYGIIILVIVVLVFAVCIASGIF